MGLQYALSCLKRWLPTTTDPLAKGADIIPQRDFSDSETLSTDSKKQKGFNEMAISNHHNDNTTDGDPTVASLTRKISTGTEELEKYFRDTGIPMPSFDVNAPRDIPKLPDDIERCRREVIQATQGLRDLLVGPRETVRWMAWDFMTTQCLQLLNHYGIAKLVPKSGTITLSELSKKTALDTTNLARVLRYATTRHVFAEPSPGVIAHTAASLTLAEDEKLQAWVGFNTEDLYPASAHVLDALKVYPEATSLTQTGFNFAFDTVDKEPMFVTFGRKPERARRMGMAMSSLTGGEGYEIPHLVDGYAHIFEDIDDRGGTVVDVGGSHGFVSVELARRYRNTRFVVQDLPKTIESAPNPICEDDAQVASRIEFQAHDFFTPQTVAGADVYLLRWIMHNYSTPYALQILRNLIPALKPGARVVINDHCLRNDGGGGLLEEQRMRGMDLVMMSLLNAQEREESEFRELFDSAGDGFVFKGVTRPKGCRMSIIEAVWKPDETSLR